MAKPPKTRHTVMPMSQPKPCLVSSVQPETSIVSGSARKVFETKPPSVAAAQVATKTMKKATPRAMRVAGATGVSGFMRRPSPRPSPTSGRGRRTSLDELRVGQLAQVGDRLDDPGFEKQVGGFLAEGGVLAGEEFLVRGAILPAQVLLASLERLGRLFDVGAHDLEALLRI